MHLTTLQLDCLRRGGSSTLLDIRPVKVVLEFPDSTMSHYKSAQHLCTSIMRAGQVVGPCCLVTLKNQFRLWDNAAVFSRMDACCNPYRPTKT